MNDAIFALGDIISAVYNIELPWWSVTFGSVVIAVFGLPILVKMYRKVMG